MPLFSFFKHSICTVKAEFYRKMISWFWLILEGPSWEHIDNIDDLLKFS